MSLRLRLSLLITSLFVSILFGSSFYIIRNARLAVSDEMESTANLTLQLVEVVLASVQMTEQSGLQQKLLDGLSQLERTRHLRILVMSRSSLDNMIPPQAVVELSSNAPLWFERLVKPPPIEYRRIFSGPGLPSTVIVIRADPSDEITEVWYETRNVLLFLLLFIIAANILVYFTLGRDLAPIESILQGLERIEKGDYQSRLPRFKLPELGRISEKINHMAAALMQSKTENRYLAQQSLKIQEQERRNLARELHDELGQSLSAIKAVAVSMDKNPMGEVESIRNGTKAIISFSEHMYEVARDMMQRLRPSVLDEFGLLKALQEMIDKWNASHEDVFCHFACGEALDDLDEEAAINLFRIVQESLTNVAKHAGASDVIISIMREKDVNEWERLKLTIQDNGRGFSVAQSPAGMGLLGIRERAEAMNGQLELYSGDGSGTRLIVTIPVNKSVEHHDAG